VGGSDHIAPLTTSERLMEELIELVGHLPAPAAVAFAVVLAAVIGVSWKGILKAGGPCQRCACRTGRRGDRRSDRPERRDSRGEQACRGGRSPDGHVRSSARGSPGSVEGDGSPELISTRSIIRPLWSLDTSPRGPNWLRGFFAASRPPAKPDQSCVYAKVR